MGFDTVQARKLFYATVVFCVILTASLTLFEVTQSLLLGTIAALVVLWTNEALPLAAVSLLPIIFFPAFGILDAKATALNYAHPIIFLFLGGFFIAIAVENSGLHKWIANKILALFPNTARGIIIALTITAGVLSSVLSNTTSTLLLMSIALFLTQDMRLKMRFALAIAYGASVGGIITPIGTPPNLILLGIMHENGMKPIAFFEWVMLVFPLAFVMFIIVAQVLSLGVGHMRLSQKLDCKPLDFQQKKVLFVIGVLIAVLFINAPIEPYWSGLGMSEAVILLSAGLVLFITPLKVLEWESDKEKIPFKIMFLFGAGFAIAKAFSHTGLAENIALYVSDIITLPLIILLLIIAALVTFMTEITSNTALISIMLPILYAATLQHNLDPELFMLVATICASYAFMLPIATPPNAIAMSSGAVHVKSMMKYGLLFNIIGIVLIQLIANFFWRHYL